MCIRDRATGQNKRYQIGVGLTLLAILPCTYVAYKVLHLGVEWAFYFTIFFSFIAQLVRADCVRRQTGINMRRFAREVVAVVVVVTLLSFALPLCFREFAFPALTAHCPSLILTLLSIFISILWTGVLVYATGITSSERRHLLDYLKEKTRKQAKEK